MSLTLHTAPGDFRAAKCLVTAKYAGVAVAVKQLSAKELGMLAKNKEFLKLNAAGKVPLLETPAGGVAQSNAICRYLARCGGPSQDLLGRSFQECAEVDQWLDFSLQEIEVSSTMLYYPALGFVKTDANTGAACKQAEGLFLAAMRVLEEHLLLRTYMVGARLTLADIALAAALFYPFKFVLDKSTRKPFGNVARWFSFIAGQPEFRAVMGDATMCKKRVAMPKAQKAGKGGGGGGGQQKKQKKPKKEEPKKELTVNDKLKKLAKSPMILDAWKKLYSCSEKSSAGKAAVMPGFYEAFDAAGWGVWRAEYNYDDDNTLLWKTGNLVEGVCARFDQLRKYMFGTIQICTKEVGKEGSQKGNIFLRGCFICRDAENGGAYMQKVNPDAEYWTFTKLDLTKDADKATLADRWCNIYENDKVEGGLTIYDAVEFK